jgi:hypothetical protein
MYLNTNQTFNTNDLITSASTFQHHQQQQQHQITLPLQYQQQFFNFNNNLSTGEFILLDFESFSLCFTFSF